MPAPVPFHRPWIGREEEEALVAALRSGWLTSGARVEEFEEACAAYLGCPHVLATSSGTAALELALLAHGVGTGDEVITTPLTFVATLAAIWSVGARPILVDVEEESGNLDLNLLEGVLTERTRAVLAVHLGGLPVNMDEFQAFTRQHGLLLLDDAAHAFEARSGSGKIGGMGDGTAFSFYANKNLTTGEGGLLTLRDRRAFERARTLRLHGIDRDAWGRRERNTGFRFYDVVDIGLKANMSDLNAALGLVQLRRTEAMLARRRDIWQRYVEGLSGLKGLALPPEPDHGDHARHVFAVRLCPDAPWKRDALIDALHQGGIATSIHFRPVHLLSGPARRLGDDLPPLPRAEAYYRCHLSLPLFPAMTDDEVHHVINTLRGLWS